MSTDTAVSRAQCNGNSASHVVPVALKIVTLALEYQGKTIEMTTNLYGNISPF